MPNFNQGSKIIVSKKETSPVDTFVSLNRQYEYQVRKKEIPGLASNYFGDSSDGELLTAGINDTHVGIAVGSLIDNMTGRTNTIFDDNTSQANSVCAYKTSSTMAYAGKDWGSGNDKVIAKATIWSSSDQGFGVSANYNTTITLEGSATGAWGGEEVELGTTGTFLDITGALEKTIYSNSNTAYRYHRFKIVSATTVALYIGEIRFFEGTAIPTTEDGDIVVKNYTNLTVPTGYTLTPSNRCRGMLLFVDGDLTVNGTISMTARGCHANPADSFKVGWIDVATAGYTVGGDMVSNGGLAAAFDGGLVEAYGASATKIAAAPVTSYIDVDFASAKKTNKFIVHASSDQGFCFTGTTLTLSIEGSTTGAWGGEEVELATTGSISDANGLIKTLEASTYWEYRYYRVKIVGGAGTAQTYIAEIQIFGEDTVYHSTNTPVAPGDGNAVGANGIRFPFFTAAGSDTLSAAELEGTGTALHALISEFPELNSNGDIIAFPRVGGAGGAGIVTTSNDAGNNGGTGTGKCGGGGSGGGGISSGFYSDDGGAGTCFSGGAGSGGRGVTKTDPSDYGGAGGDGAVIQDSAGTGNPSGIGNGTEVDGTGGLLIIICSGNITGTGTIESHGILSQDGLGGGYGAGGASGGGNILVARVGTDATVTKTATGGVGGIVPATGNGGGSGGAGSIQTLQISA